MTFVKVDGVWYEQDSRGRGSLYNYYDGYIDDTCHYDDIVDCENWHELYLSTDFRIGTDKKTDAWISPQGDVFYCDCHYVGAEQILEVVIGYDVDKTEFDTPDDILCDRGWCKVTTSVMWDVRFNEWEDMTLTQAQIDTVTDWCIENGFRIPKFGEVL